MALRENTFLFAKIEPSPRGGTKTFAAGDAVHIMTPRFAYSDTQTLSWKPANGAFIPTEEIVVGKLGQITCETYMRGSGTAGTVPNHSLLYRMAGFSETIVAITSVTYADANTALDTGEIAYYLDGLEIIMDGCVATYEGQSEAASGSKESWTIKGHIVSVTDTAMPAGAVYPDIDPILMCGLAATVTRQSDSEVFNPDFANLSFKLGNEVISPVSASSNDCFGLIRIADRNPEGSYDPEVTSVATHDFHGNWTGGEKFDFDTGAIGTAGNQVQVQLTGARYKEYSEGDRDKAATYEVPFSYENLSIAYT